MFAGIAASEHVTASRCPVVSIVEGQAASAATLIAVVADERVITPRSFMLIHEISSSMWGGYKTTDIGEELDNLRTLESSLRGIYEEHTSVTGPQLDRLLRKDVYWKAGECLKRRFVDRVGYS